MIFMARRISIKLVGVEQIKQLLKGLKKTARKEEDNIGLAARNFVENFWKPQMPVVSGFMRNTATSLQQGKGKAIAFTQTSQKKTGGYARFPEEGKAIKGKAILWKNPHFTEKAVNAFKEKFFKDAEIKIDIALRR